MTDKDQPPQQTTGDDLHIETENENETGTDQEKETGDPILDLIEIEGEVLHGVNTAQEDGVLEVRHLLEVDENQKDLVEEEEMTL